MAARVCSATTQRIHTTQRYTAGMVQTRATKRLASALTKEADGAGTVKAAKKEESRHHHHHTPAPAKEEDRHVRTAAPAKDTAACNYFLMKSEGRKKRTHGPDGASIGAQEEQWDGVRNHAAKNIMKEMKKGDKALFYHSNAKPPGVVGTMTICKEAYVDYTAFDPKDKHYDPKSQHDNPRWYMVDVKLDTIFPEVIPLDRLREHRDGALRDMVLFTQGRLSVQRVPRHCYDYIVDTLQGGRA